MPRNNSSMDGRAPENYSMASASVPQPIAIPPTQPAARQRSSVLANFETFHSASSASKSSTGYVYDSPGVASLVRNPSGMARRMTDLDGARLAGPQNIYVK